MNATDFRAPIRDVLSRNPQDTPAASSLLPPVLPTSGGSPVSGPAALALIAAATLLATMVRATCPQEVRDDNAVWAALRVVEDAAVRARVDVHMRRERVVRVEHEDGEGFDVDVASTEGQRL